MDQEPPNRDGGRGYYLITVRVLEMSSPKRKRRTDQDPHVRRKKLGHAPNESTTRTVQMNVKEETTVVEMVSYVVQKLQLPSGLRWNCQYLDRVESKWKTVVRNHSAGVLASSEFQGVGPDGIQIRLVAPNAPAEVTNHRGNGGGSNNSIATGVFGGGGMKTTTSSTTSTNIHNIQPTERTVKATMDTSPVREAASSSVGSSLGSSSSSSDGIGTHHLDKPPAVKRFVMRSTPTRKMHKRNVGRRGGMHSTSSTTTSSSTTTWETPMFELEGWDDTSPTHYRRLGHNYDPLGEEEELSPRTFDTSMEEIVDDQQSGEEASSTDLNASFGQKNKDGSLSNGRSEIPERLRQLTDKNKMINSPIDHDKTYASLSTYGGRLPYYLASSHLLVDDDIDSKKMNSRSRGGNNVGGAGGAGGSGGSGSHSKHAQKKHASMRGGGGARSGYIKLMYQAEPALDKMNLLAKSMIQNFGMKKTTNNRFRLTAKFQEEREAREEAEKLERDAAIERRKQREREEEEEEWDEFEEISEEEGEEEEEGGVREGDENEDEDDPSAGESYILREDSQVGLRFNMELKLKLK